MAAQTLANGSLAHAVFRSAASQRDSVRVGCVSPSRPSAILVPWRGSSKRRGQTRFEALPRSFRADHRPVRRRLQPWMSRAASGRRAVAAPDA